MSENNSDFFITNEESAQFDMITPEKFDIDPFTMVIFGGTGDLSKRKLLTTLYHICLEGDLPDEFSILAFASSAMSDEGYREVIKKAIQDFGEKTFNEKCWDEFSRHLFYISGDFEDENSYRRLSKRLEEITKITGKGTREVIFYMAVSPHYSPVIIERLSVCDLCKGMFNTRVIIEKPFGRDKASAVELNRIIARAFDEKQVYRIDHYLGKETVQNIIFFRFVNSIFEPLWNRRYIDHVQITVAEDIGVENRARFYEKAGVVRDIVQNHMLQLLSLVAMEPPIGFEADFIRDEKVKVFRTIRSMDEAYIDRFTVCGQYGPGKINNKDVPGYREEKNVSPDSNTPTFMAARLYLDNWRWANVPFYLRAGKRMGKRITEISIHFKQPPLRLFSSSCDVIEPNLLVLGIQPHEEISLRFGVKYPGAGNQIYHVNMDFSYERTFKTTSHPAYERLLIDCMKGDLTLFARQDEVEAMWSVVDPVINRWENKQALDFPDYAAGAWGPQKAEDMMRNEGRRWQI